jgi:protein-S-isoprenylcysteine O-methyltransferase Ste14
MDPINILIGINIIAVFGAIIPAAKKGFKSVVAEHREKPKSYLQRLPNTLATISLIALIIAVFQIGTLEYKTDNNLLRLLAFAVYVVFSWVQIWVYKSLGDNYSQDVVIFKKHSLITTGPYKYIRHPQYAAQILVDIAAAFATLSYVVLILAIIEIPFLIKRGFFEDKLLKKYFGEKFDNYKKKSGFMFPFLG